MKNIGKVFINDIKHIYKNVIALIVVLGLSVVPSLYAWFNIAASWDPYGSTGNLKVAVASMDKGYEGSLVPLELNLGEKIMSSLRENEQLDWVFTDKDEALEGVKSGEYYAAIVIPESFSEDMMSLFSRDVHKSDILYYLNEKENAIAPKVTDKGAGAVQQQVDEIFARTVALIGLDVLDALSAVMEQEGAQTAANNLAVNVRKIAGNLEAASETVDALFNMTVSMQQMLDTTSAFLKQTGTNIEQNMELLKGTSNKAEDLDNALLGTTESISQVLEQGSACYQAVSGEIEQAFASMGSDTGNAGNSLSGISEEVQAIIDSYAGLRDSLEELAAALPLYSDSIRPVIANLNESIAYQETIRDKLNDTEGKIAQTAVDIRTYQEELQELIGQKAQEISAVQAEYESNLRQQLDELFGTLRDTNASVSAILSSLNQSVSGIEEMSDSATSDLGSLTTCLETSSSLLKDAAQKVNGMLEELEEAAQDGDLQTVKNILGSDPADVSAFIAAPVQKETKVLYPVENYGSAMAPFYTALSIWVGGIVLVAMLKTTVSKETKNKLSHVKNYQMYFGRYILFLLMGLIQSGLICLGDLFFLGIQCEHPVLFLLSGWITSIVFVNIIYTLTVSFGDIGKAVCVVLLVMQVAGSGGTFPIEVAPKFFRLVYPLLPFTHSMTAMRECIGGLYGNTYWMELGKLGIFFVLSLFLGLVLRKPVIHLNELFMEKLESTKLM